MPKTHHTPKQIEINDCINEIGFQTDMETVFGKYMVDIFIPELGWACEIEGPQHYKKERIRRDRELKKYEIKLIVHVPVNIKRQDFINKFNELLERKFNG